MAALKEWNEGIAWYFLDRPEAEGKRSRISLTEARVKQIAEYLKEHLNLTVSEDPVEDLLQSVFDKAGHDDHYGGSTSILECASRLFYNATTLAQRYDRWRGNGGPSGEDYPDLIPPFLAHMGICTLAMSKYAELQHVYLPIARLLVEHVEVRDFRPPIDRQIEKVKKRLVEDYRDIVRGFAWESYQIGVGGTVRDENIWKHIETWSNHRHQKKIESGNPGGGRFVSVLAYTGHDYVYPIRYASQIRSVDEGIFGDILDRSSPDFEPERDQIRSRINRRKNFFGAGVKKLIGAGKLEDLVDHVLQRWSTEDPDSWGNGTTESRGSEALFQVKPVLWVPDEVRGAMVRLHQTRGATIPKVKMVTNTGRELDIPLSGMASDPIGSDEEESMEIWRGEFSLSCPDGELDSKSVIDWIDGADSRKMCKDSRQLWEHGNPTVGQRWGIMKSGEDDGNQDRVLSMFSRKPIHFNERSAISRSAVIADETKVSLRGGMKISGRYLRNCLPSLVVTRGSPDHVELYPASEQGGGTPVKWEDYLDSLPELVENRWVFTPKQGIDELEIAYRIGRQSTERHSLKITDGADLWREIPAEEGMGCDIQSVDSSSGEVDISEMFKTSQEEFEKREKYVKLRFGMGFVFEDKDSGVYIAGIGLKDLLKFSRLERRKRLVTPQGPPPVDLVGAKEESMQADLAIKQMANKAAAEKAEAAEKKAEKKAAAKKAAKKKAEAAEKASKKAIQDRIDKANDWINDLKGMQDNMEESGFTPYEVRVNQETLGRAKAAVCASSGTPLVGKGSVSFPCPGCSLPIGRSSRCRVQSVKYICPNCRFEGP